VSDDDVEQIHRVNTAIASKDLDAVSRSLHPDVVWEHNVGRGTPEEGIYRGRDSVLQLFERIVEPWAYLRPEPSRIEEVGDGEYRIQGELHAKHADTAAEILSPYEQHVEMRDGLLVTARMTSWVNV